LLGNVMGIEWSGVLPKEPIVRFDARLNVDWLLFCFIFIPVSVSPSYKVKQANVCFSSEHTYSNLHHYVAHRDTELVSMHGTSYWEGGSCCGIN